MRALPCDGNEALFFPEGYLGKPEPGETYSPPDYQSDEAMAARALCAGCPVREWCLDRAIEIGAEYGIYGALDPDERVREVVRRALRQV